MLASARLRWLLVQRRPRVASSRSSRRPAKRDSPAWIVAQRASTSAPGHEAGGGDGPGVDHRVRPPLRIPLHGDGRVERHPGGVDPDEAAYVLDTAELAREGEDERLGHAHDGERDVGVPGDDEAPGGRHHAEAEQAGIRGRQGGVDRRERSVVDAAEQPVGLLDADPDGVRGGQPAGRDEPLRTGRGHGQPRSRSRAGTSTPETGERARAVRSPGSGESRGPRDGDRMRVTPPPDEGTIMATLTVWKFDSANGADDATDVLRNLASQEADHHPRRGDGEVGGGQEEAQDPPAHQPGRGRGPRRCVLGDALRADLLRARCWAPRSAPPPVRWRARSGTSASTTASSTGCVTR